MRRLQHQFRDELIIIGIHSGKFLNEKFTSNIQQAVIKLGIEHPVVNDPDFFIWQQYAIKAWPTLVLINPHGKIVSEISGEILADPFAHTIEDLIYEHHDQIDRTPLVLRNESIKINKSCFQYPSKLIFNHTNKRLYLSDTGNHRIVEININNDNKSGEVYRVFGNGNPGLQDGIADEIKFNQPHGLALSGDNKSLFVADTENHVIRAIDLNEGYVNTIAGKGEKAHSFIKKGNPLEMPLRSPWAIDSFGKYLFIAMAGSHQIWVLIDNNELFPFAGNGREALIDGPITEASFNQPSDIRFKDNVLYIADTEASAIRMITLNKPSITKTIIGQGLFEFGDRDGSLDQAQLQHPAGIDIQRNRLFIADTYNHKIKTLDLHTNQLVTLAGNGKPGDINGPLEQAKLNEPEGVLILNDYLYITDTNNHKLKVIDLNINEIEEFKIFGTEKLILNNKFPIQTIALNPIEICPGETSVYFDIKLPKGFIRNKNAPSSIIRKDVNPERVLYIDESNRVVIKLNDLSDTKINLELKVYYCLDSSYDVCFIHNKRIILPININLHAQPVSFTTYTIDKELI